MSTEMPPDIRPYRVASEPGDERVTHTIGSRQTWRRQIGWHGQTGAFYRLGEDPSPYERGSSGALWILVEDEQLPDADLDDDAIADDFADILGNAFLAGQVLREARASVALSRPQSDGETISVGPVTVDGEQT